RDRAGVLLGLELLALQRLEIVPELLDLRFEGSRLLRRRMTLNLLAHAPDLVAQLLDFLLLLLETLLRRVVAARLGERERCQRRQDARPQKPANHLSSFQ